MKWMLIKGCECSDCDAERKEIDRVWKIFAGVKRWQAFRALQKLTERKPLS